MIEQYREYIESATSYLNRPARFQNKPLLREKAELFEGDFGRGHDTASVLSTRRLALILDPTLRRRYPPRWGQECLSVSSYYRGYCNTRMPMDRNACPQGESEGHSRCMYAKSEWLVPAQSDAASQSSPSAKVLKSS